MDENNTLESLNNEAAELKPTEAATQQELCNEITESAIEAEAAMEDDVNGVSASEPDTASNAAKTLSSEIFEWLEVLVTAIVAVVIIFSLIFRVATIDGESMENTLFQDEKVIITNVGYTPKPGDIVVISRNIENSIDGEQQSQLPIIKRVIATEGQTVNIDFEQGMVYVDNVLIDDSYTKTPTNLQYHDGVEFPLTVAEGCIFVLGDNRNDSLDSRSSRIGNNGMIDVRYVLGHAVLRIFPFNKIGGL